MILDSSAVLAVLNREPDAGSYEARMIDALSCRMSVVNVLEVTMVVEGRGGPGAGAELDRLLERLGVEVVPVTLEQLASARYAWRRFGKGNHPAGLNFGDCFAYALADVSREPLLFKGEDFSRTDVTAA